MTQEGSRLAGTRRMVPILDHSEEAAPRTEDAPWARGKARMGRLVCQALRALSLGWVEMPVCQRQRQAEEQNSSTGSQMAICSLSNERGNHNQLNAKNFSVKRT